MSAPPTDVAADAARWLRGVLAPGAPLVADSRAVRAGAAFLAHPGERGDGRDHVARAIAAGAAAVLHEREGFSWRDEWAVPHLAVEGLRALAGPIASQWWGRPSERLAVIAVTGTNGKTSCTHGIAQLLAACGRRSAVVGTLGAGEPGALESFGLTTPDAPTLQRLLAGFVARGLEAAAIEASSIGLHQQRLAGTRITTAAFTNLTRDHLDYHGDMGAYARAKAALFAWPGLQSAVVNADDAAAAAMLQAAGPGVRRIGFSVAARAAGMGASAGTPAARLQDLGGLRLDGCLRAVRAEPAGAGTAVQIESDWGRADVRLALLGRHNVQNALAVLAVALAEGVPFAQAAAALERLAPVPGRMQAVAVDGAPLVVVDYAHTPDALENVLSALAPVAAARGGRLWCLFGAGGDRDPGKRPLMGSIAARLADEVVLASDNPRSENPASILAQIAAGMPRAPRHVDVERRAAIEWTLAQAAPQDLVLVAGKGHEDYQEAGGTRLPFSDVEVARAALLRAREGKHDV